MALPSAPRVAAAERLAPGPEREHPSGLRPLRLFNLEVSLDTASIESVERVARRWTGRRVAAWFAADPGAEELAVVSTCHRVELYLAARDEQEAKRWQGRLPASVGSSRLRADLEAARHLLDVAAGRRSLAVGEREVREQVRAAARSVVSRHPRPLLRELLESAIAAVEELDPDAAGARSIAAVAATTVLERVGRPFPRVVVLGAGRVGRQVAESLASSARVTLVYRERVPDERFLRATGARAVRFPHLADEVAVADAVVAAAKSGTRCLGPEDLPRDRPMLLIDLGVPRNIDPSVRSSPNLELIDLADLRSSRPPQPPDPRTDALLDGLAERVYRGFEQKVLEAWVGALRRSTEAMRRGEVARARPFLGELTSDQEVAVERLTLRLVARILGGPTGRLRSLPPGPEGDLFRRFALELFDPGPPDP